MGILDPTPLSAAMTEEAAKHQAEKDMAQAKEAAKEEAKKELEQHEENKRQGMI
jgi:hypothetical protein